MDRTLVSSLFASQDSLARTDQLRLAGVTPGMIRQRIATGEWERHARGVIGLAGVVSSWRRSLRAALLAAGPRSVVSHASAARLHGFDGYERDERLMLTALGGEQIRALAGVEVVRSRVLGGRECVTVGGFRTTIRPVTLIDLAATDGRDAARRALDSMLRRGDSAAWIDSTARRWSRPGLPGPSVVLGLLHERIDGRLPRSWFQRLTKRALDAHGIHMVDEFPVRDGDGRLLAELDLALPELSIGVECQSWRWHATPSARAADARRRRRLRALGWAIVEVWWTDPDHLDEVFVELGSLLEERRTTSVPAVRGR